MINLQLSIVVIGRNEGKNLPSLAESLSALKGTVSSEVIYVDSASSDESVEVATSFFDKVVILDEDQNLCASAGRYIGAIESRGPWILFLDGDMRLCPEFIPEIVRHIFLGDYNTGLVGGYNFISPGGRRRLNVLNSKSGVVNFFGGAVLLPAKILKNENWNPGIFSNEEIELYTRLRSHRVNVVYRDVCFVEHYTEEYSKLETLRMILVSNDTRTAKKNLGVGQILSARFRRGGKPFSLVRWFPEPFAVWSGLLLTFCLFFAFSAPVALIPSLVVVFFVTLRRNLRYNILCFAYLFQVLRGVRAYRPGWNPRIRTILRGNISP